MYTITLKDHTTETGHRIPGHQGGAGKCARLHGHTYRYQVTLAAEILEDDFVVDFGAVKEIIDRWDHRLLLWEDDPLTRVLDDFSHASRTPGGFNAGLLIVQFIPTVERMAETLAFGLMREFDHLAYAVVEIWETAKTSAFVTVNARDVGRT